MRLDEIEDRIADAIAALDATAYQQGSPTEPWVESTVPLPLAPEMQPEAVSHLAFSVRVEQAGNARMERDAIGDRMRASTVVRVFWAYRLRPTEAVADHRMHLRSAGDILAAVNDDVSAWDGDGDAVSMIETLWEVVYTTAQTGSPYQVAAATFRIDHWLTL